MKDRLDRVIYVGKARDLRKRLASYFTPSRLRLADLKTRALIESIWNFETHIVRSELEALLLEGKLIKEFRPRYNISFRDDKRFLLVKVNLNDPFPRFQLTRVKKDDGARYFGPFAHSGALRATLNLMKKLFGLRSCRPIQPGEADYKHCLDHVIKNCSAPCIGKVSGQDYLERVNRACAFLEGQSREMIESLQAEMEQAARRLDFERAAQLRDMLDDLKKTTAPARRFARKFHTRSLDPEGDLAALAEALSLPRGPEIMECFDISNISSSHIVASMVCFRKGTPDQSSYRRYRIRGVEGQNDFASMGEVIRRRYARVLQEVFSSDVSLDAQTSQLSAVEAATKAAESARRPVKGRLPDLIIVDGGRGQLSAACKELQRLGLHDLQIIGLAKENEEIFRPGRPVPLRLPADSGALKLLQRIRDEAHRFANGYHQLLMKRRVEESILDDCPGISQHRKAALLRTFGSVKRIRQANFEDLVKVEGISQRLAETLKQFLETH